MKRHGQGPRPARMILTGMVALGLLVVTAACGGGSSGGVTPAVTSPGSATSTSTPSATATATASPTTRRDSAAGQLSRFFAAAARADQQLHHAAALVNAGIGPQQIMLPPATVAAVKAIDIAAVGRAIPAGTDSRLMGSLLQVYGDLADRRAAMDRVIEFAADSPLAAGSAQAKDLVRCLANGRAPASWYDKDLGAAQTRAAATAPFTPAAADSRAAGVVAIHRRLIDGPNTCAAGECGGLYKHPFPVEQVVWKTIVRDGVTWDGQLAGTNAVFTAQYTSAKGWTIGFNAC